MDLVTLAAEPTKVGLLDLDLSFVAEVIAFIAMILILAKWVYPRVIAAAEARQKQVSEQLAQAELSRKEAEASLKKAQAQLDEARGEAQGIIAGANRSAEQLREELRARAEEDAKRITEGAKKEIDAERQKAVDSVRGELAGLVIEATSKVLGETLDADRHRKLIDRAIEEVGGQRQR